ncbi:MAG: hypothetical protein WBF93_21005, partial [Pirellulales bacterium]
AGTESQIRLTASRRQMRLPSRDTDACGLPLNENGRALKNILGSALLSVGQKLDAADAAI